MATGYTHISIPAKQNPLLSPENEAVYFGMASVWAGFGHLLSTRTVTRSLASLESSSQWANSQLTYLPYHKRRYFCSFMPGAITFA